MHVWVEQKSPVFPVLPVFAVLVRLPVLPVFPVFPVFEAGVVAAALPVFPVVLDEHAATPAIVSMASSTTITWRAPRRGAPVRRIILFGT